MVNTFNDLFFAQSLHHILVSLSQVISSLPCMRPVDGKNTELPLRPISMKPKTPFLTVGLILQQSEGRRA